MTRWAQSTVGWLAAAALAFAACSAEEPPSPARAVAPLDPPSERIVSLARMPSALLVELGAAGRVVAVDRDSSILPGLTGAAVLDPSDAALSRSLDALHTDLLVLPASHAGRAAALHASGRRIVIANAHDFDEGYALFAELGALVGLGPLMHDRVREHSRPLARLSAASYGEVRPRVVAIASLEPLAIVGGHDFVAALIEHAGGENVTHGRAESTIEMDAREIRALKPELVLWARPRALEEGDRAALERAVGAELPIASVVFDRDLFFDEVSVDAVAALRRRLVEIAAARP